LEHHQKHPLKISLLYSLSYISHFLEFDRSAGRNLIAETFYCRLDFYHVKKYWDLRNERDGCPYQKSINPHPLDKIFEGIPVEFSTPAPITEGLLPFQKSFGKLARTKIILAKMIRPSDEEDILRRAYIPEHIVSLMALLSKGEPFLIEDHLIFAKDNWLILVGYPLDGMFSQERCERVLKKAVETFRPEYLWFIGPEIPLSLAGNCKERQTDQYYRFEIGQTKVKSSLQKMVEKVSHELRLERATSISKDHHKLISEALKREKLPPRIKELYRAMPDYVAHSSSVCVLNALDKKGRLCAFYIVELAAKDFSTYLIGTHSKINYVPHASDLLFFEMIHLTVDHGKNRINLGLGVNEGIRRFKEKWGGKAFLNYEFCERFYGYTRTVSLIKSLEGKL